MHAANICVEKPICSYIKVQQIVDYLLELRPLFDQVLVRGSPTTSRTESGKSFFSFSGNAGNSFVQRREFCHALSSSSCSYELSSSYFCFLFTLDFSPLIIWTCHFLSCSVSSFVIYTVYCMSASERGIITISFSIIFYMCSKCIFSCHLCQPQSAASCMKCAIGMNLTWLSWLN